MQFPVFKKARVLIIDDEASNVRLLERILDLAKVGHVCSTTDSREALKLFINEQPDIVLLDLHMPHVDGFTIMAQIQSSVSDGEYLPVLVLTADITPETRHRALTLGAQDFLTKPFDHSEVLMRMRNLLENRFLHSELRLQNTSLETLVSRRTSELEQTLGRLKATQQQLVKQERLRALGMMASGIAHDFNNALMLVLGYAELLQPHIAALDGEREKFLLANLKSAAQDGAHVVSRLQEFYRPAGNAHLRVGVDVNQTIEHALTLTAPRWRDKCRAEGIQIDPSLELTPVPNLLGNAAELREVLINLIFNAVDAMPQGGRLVLRTKVQDGRIQIEVSDTGVGMSEEECARCLEPFFTTKGESGTGLGLASVYGFVQRYGGAIRVKSEKGKGASFTLTLPASDAQIDRTQIQPHEPTSPLKILIVDDQEIIRELIAEILRSDGHNITVAATGVEALLQLNKGQFDLLISDLSMPDMTGSQLASEIRAKGDKTPFILLTGFGDEMLAQGSTPLGVDLVLSKPVTSASLYQAIKKILPTEALGDLQPQAPAEF
jgi:signal transduction histidine kinase